MRDGLDLASHAQRARDAFNARFWYAEGGYLYDVVDGERGDDTACRPNQVFAISLDHPVLDESRWEPVMERRAEPAADARRPALAGARPS